MPPLPADSSYWPSIEAVMNHAGANYNFEQVENNIEGLVIHFLDNGMADQAQTLTITEEWIDGSGGHDHVNELASNADARRGFTIVGSEPPILHRGTLSTTTDPAGTLQLDYRTPELGGRVVLEAEAAVAGDTLRRSSPEIVVRVPGLVQLPDNALLYQKVGGTAAHHGPPLFPDIEDDDNHWIDPAFQTPLVTLATAWQQFVDANPATENANQRILRINDVSLPNGGLFDFQATWWRPHRFHRVGRDADIRTGVQPSFALPPVPPAGSFDARFSGGGRLIEGTEGTIQLQATAYPLTVELTGDTNGRTWVVEELVNGEVAAAHPVDAGASIEITNTAVTALRIRLQ